MEIRGERARSACLRRVGYFYRRIEDIHAHFVIANSEDSNSEMQAEITQILDEIDVADPRPRILLVHHKLWSWPGMTHFFEGKFDAVIAGDATRHYTEHVIERSYAAYSVGMSFVRANRNEPIFFVVGTIGADGVLSMKPVVMDHPPDIRWPSGS